MVQLALPPQSTTTRQESTPVQRCASDGPHEDTGMESSFALLDRIHQSIDTPPVEYQTGRKLISADLNQVARLGV